MISSYTDGIFYSLMVGLVESYFAAYALSLGFGELLTSHLAVLPIFAGSLWQFVTPYGLSRVNSRRLWVVCFAGLQSLALFGAGALAFIPEASPLWLFFWLSLYWAGGLCAGPAWNAWISTLVRPKERMRFFSERNRWLQGATFLAMLFSGLCLEYGREIQSVRPFFGMLFFLAAVMRVVSVYLLSQQIELRVYKGGRSSTAAPVATPGSAERIDTSLLLVGIVGMSFAVHWSAPYFTPYMLKVLELNYISYMVLMSATFLGRILSYRSLARIGQKKGPLTLMWWGALGIMPTPFLWSLGQNFPFLLSLQLYSGMAWGAYELGLSLHLMEKYSTERLAKLHTWINFLNAFGMIAGSLSASRLMGFEPSQARSYLAIFVSSSVLRLLPLVLISLRARRLRQSLLGPGEAEMNQAA